MAVNSRGANLQKAWPCSVWAGKIFFWNLEDFENSQFAKKLSITRNNNEIGFSKSQCTSKYATQRNLHMLAPGFLNPAYFLNFAHIYTWNETSWCTCITGGEVELEKYIIEREENKW